eukprot:403337702
MSEISETNTDDAIVFITQTFTSLILFSKSLKFEKLEKRMFKFLVLQLTAYYNSIDYSKEQICLDIDYQDQVTSIFYSLTRFLKLKENQILSVITNNSNYKVLCDNLIARVKYLSFTLKTLIDKNITNRDEKTAYVVYCELNAILQFIKSLMAYQNEYVTVQFLQNGFPIALQICLENLFELKKSEQRHNVVCQALKCFKTLICCTEINQVIEKLINGSQLVKTVLDIPIEHGIELELQSINELTLIVQSLTYVSDSWCIEHLINHYNLIQSTILLLRFSEQDQHLLETNLSNLTLIAVKYDENIKYYPQSMYEQEGYFQSLFSQNAYNFYFDAYTLRTSRVMQYFHREVQSRDDEVAFVDYLQCLYLFCSEETIGNKAILEYIGDLEELIYCMDEEDELDIDNDGDDDYNVYERDEDGINVNGIDKDQNNDAQTQFLNSAMTKLQQQQELYQQSLDKTIQSENSHFKGMYGFQPKKRGRQSPSQTNRFVI